MGERLKIAVHLWLVYGLQWRNQYMKFGLRRAWGMAGNILEFRRASAKFHAYTGGENG